jgi:hypothetical protein
MRSEGNPAPDAELIGAMQEMSATIRLGPHILPRIPVSGK